MSDFLGTLRVTFADRPFKAQDVLLRISRDDLPPFLQYAVDMGARPVLSIGRHLAVMDGVKVVHGNGKHGKLYQVV